MQYTVLVESNYSYSAYEWHPPTGTSAPYIYPMSTCVKGLSNQFCPSVSQSVSQSVYPVKHFEI